MSEHDPTLPDRPIFRTQGAPGSTLSLLLLLLFSFTNTGMAATVDSLEPLPASEWSYDHAAHLLERAGFGGTPEEIARFAAMTPEAAVDLIVNYEQIADTLPPFEHSGIWDEAMLADVDLHLRFDDVMAKAAEVGEVYGEVVREEGPRKLQDITDALYYKYLSSNREWQRVAQWWAERMLTSPRPLEEKMTLFWHGHFATEELKNDDYRLMLQQNTTLRQLATSDMSSLLIAMSKDPAMLLYLDNRLNVKGHANENYAREILELFSLGIGNYTENDIKEAARAFTGWRNQGLTFIDDRAQHDEGMKTVFGQTGNWDGEDVVDLILQQEAAGEFIAGKIYRFFVREEISEQMLDELAARLRDDNYALKPFLRALFLSQDFYSEPSLGTQIKSPVQFLVSTYRKLGLERIPGTPYFPAATNLLGQALGNPPNVKGWDGGRAWLNPSTILLRNNLIGHLLFPETAAGAYPRFAYSTRYSNAPAEARQRDRDEALAFSSESGSVQFSASAASEDAQGMSADISMMASTAPSAARHNARADYDLKLGLYRGITKSYERVRPIPPTPAPFDLSGMLQNANIASAEDAVIYLERRFLRLRLFDEDRQDIVEFLQGRMPDGFSLRDSGDGETERSLRLTLQLILSTPEYQLG
ncbi:MAG: DUF1800 domain-containing protein [Pseudohongiellaceae bacterium]